MILLFSLDGILVFSWRSRARSPGILVASWWSYGVVLAC